MSLLVILKFINDLWMRPYIKNRQKLKKEIKQMTINLSFIESAKEMEVPLYVPAGSNDPTGYLSIQE